LTQLGIENVRIRGAKPGDTPKVSNHGTAERPSFEVFGLITARDQLQLKGGTFSRSDRAGIKDYFDRLAADGAEALTASRGMFGMTAKDIEAMFADFAQPINFETKGKPLPAVIAQLQSKFAAKVDVAADADRAVREAKPLADELKGVSAGTALAMMLRASGLVLRPEKPRGQAIIYYVEAAGSAASTTTGAPTVVTVLSEHAGKTDDAKMVYWPIGWEPHNSPGEAAPSLFEMLNAEIDGYSLAEALAAIGPRLKVPIFVDHAALAAKGIDMAKVQVKLPRTRTSYKRVIDRALSQARLGSEVRVDESGKAFLWVTR
jgi:hypothetical protein